MSHRRPFLFRGRQCRGWNLKEKLYNSVTLSFVSVELYLSVPLRVGRVVSEVGGAPKDRVSRCS